MGPTTVVGWVSGPNGRGTSDVIWGSFSTIFLCTWTAVALNIPHPEDSYFRKISRRAKWMFWAIVGPELVLSVAIGQFASARRSVQRFHAMGYTHWTLRHAFFADMGGILVEPKDSTPFLVNSRQLAYLVEKKYLECPTISAEEIWDKSKADTTAKFLALMQAFWLVLQLSGRAILHLATSMLELSAAAIVFCTLGTFFCWFHKPSDVDRGIVIKLEATTAQILIEAGDAAAAPYIHTPLDFVAKQSYTCGYDVLGFFGLRCDNRERPLRRFPNDRFPDIGTLEKFILFCITTSYAASHLIAWRFYFPTKVELILWRTSCLIVAGTTLFFWIVETIAARHRFGRWDKYMVWLRPKTRHNLPTAHEAGGSITPEIVGTKNVVRPNLTTLESFSSFEMEQKNAKPMLAWEVFMILPIVILYALARAYMIIEVLVSLRELPIGVYETFDLGQVWPHW